MQRSRRAFRLSSFFTRRLEKREEKVQWKRQTFKNIKWPLLLHQNWLGLVVLLPLIFLNIWVRVKPISLAWNPSSSIMLIMLAPIIMPISPPIEAEKKDTILPKGIPSWIAKVSHIVCHWKSLVSFCKPECLDVETQSWWLQHL